MKKLTKTALSFGLTKSPGLHYRLKTTRPSSPSTYLTRVRHLHPWIASSRSTCPGLSLLAGFLDGQHPSQLSDPSPRETFPQRSRLLHRKKQREKAERENQKKVGGIILLYRSPLSFLDPSKESKQTDSLLARRDGDIIESLCVSSCSASDIVAAFLHKSRAYSRDGLCVHGLRMPSNCSPTDENPLAPLFFSSPSIFFPNPISLLAPPVMMVPPCNENELFCSSELAPPENPPSYIRQ